MDIVNDTAVNVAALLRDQIGAKREYPVLIDRFALDNDLLIVDLHGTVKLTRLADEILANISASGAVTLECLRCLREFVQPVETTFEEEYRVAFDLRTGTGITGSQSDERFEINEAHELDFGEALRQEIILALPMRPVCGYDCPGPATISADTGPFRDNRFAALAELLGETGIDEHRQ